MRKQWSPSLSPLAPCCRCCIQRSSLKLVLLVTTMILNLLATSQLWGCRGQSKADSLTAKKEPVQAAVQAAKGTSSCTLHISPAEHKATSRLSFSKVSPGWCLTQLGLLHQLVIRYSRPEQHTQV